jgi:hypothetical protein
VNGSKAGSRAKAATNGAKSNGSNGAANDTKAPAKRRRTASTR